MTTHDFLTTATQQLSAAGIATARLDCLVLLEDVLSTNRTHILADPERELSEKQKNVLSSQLTRRATHEPLAYIRNTSEFYGRSFYIDQRVLEPRPESESIIDLLLHLPLPAQPTVADIGTGSGALAITAALVLPGASVVATDIDPACLAVASQNAGQLAAPVTLLAGNLFQPIATAGLRPDVVLCNLPYVPDSFPIAAAAMHEPRHAIFGGGDGLDLYRTLFAQLSGIDHPPAFIIAESMPPQHDVLAAIAAAAGYTLQSTDNFVQAFSFRTDSGRSAA